MQNRDLLLETYSNTLALGSALKLENRVEYAKENILKGRLAEDLSDSELLEFINILVGSYLDFHL
jgi:hypothetical protein